MGVPGPIINLGLGEQRDGEILRKRPFRQAEAPAEKSWELSAMLPHSTATVWGP